MVEDGRRRSSFDRPHEGGAGSHSLNTSIPPGGLEVFISAQYLSGPHIDKTFLVMREPEDPRFGWSKSKPAVSVVVPGTENPAYKPGEIIHVFPPGTQRLEEIFPQSKDQSTSRNDS